jgi:hypothetical protein
VQPGVKEWQKDESNARIAKGGWILHILPYLYHFVDDAPETGVA